MHKYLPILAFVGAFSLNAASPLELSVRGVVVGRVYNDGATFATKMDADLAIRRGDDPNSPVVGNVCRLFYTTAGGETAATVTQIQPDIFLCCKHTATELIKAVGLFTEKGQPMAVGLVSGKEALAALSIAAPCLHPSADLALIKLKFGTGRIPDCKFLPFANPLDCESVSGFVVSQSEVSVVNEDHPCEADKRTVSIHQFQEKLGNFISSIPGEIDDTQKEKMREALVSFAKKPDEESKITLKAIASTAKLTFPETGTKSSQGLMSVLGAGNSGAPLIVKQNGIYKIMGMLTRGAFFPESIASGADVTVISDENLSKIVYRCSFLDLTQHREWIAQAIAKIQSAT